MFLVLTKISSYQKLAKEVPLLRDMPSFFKKKNKLQRP